ncbi:MAG TPA: GNAT family N-acetyltransferase [Anaeromyxobacter sp.]|nr:GNAT family N-acetyltransferase [Anaeromyxobacter sp.]
MSSLATASSDAARGPTAERAAARFAVLDAANPADAAIWLDRWRRWPGREVSAHPAYARLFARPFDRTVCLLGEDAGGAILFPLLLRPLAAEPWARAGEARWDAISPYGYGGPYAWGTPDAKAFWQRHAEWCADARVVSTFVRLSLFPDQLARLPDGVEERAPNIAIPLEGDAEALWRGYDTRVRKWIRVAEGAGLRVERDDAGARLDGFIAVYEHTMKRHEAGDWYYFPRALFEAIRDGLHGQYTFFHTLSGDQVVSSDLVLVSAEHVYYFLGGTLTDAFPLGPNYLLKHAVATWAQGLGKRRYVLGGGYQPGDGVYRYKRGWARHGEVPFRVARWTHDAGASAELLAQRASHGGASWSPAAGFFPPYRG